jgi:predicted acylesterase/phospholipase RssA
MNRVDETTASRHPRSDPPALECDIVMKGGITSGVIYPNALAAIGSTYRIRGIGGASAGAIGAALGAAAEFGRSAGGYEKLEELPQQLGEGALAGLFQPQRPTRQLLRLMLAATSSDQPGTPPKGASRIVALLLALTMAFPWAGILGALTGVALIVIGATSGGLSGWFLVGAGVLLMLVGWVVAIVMRLIRKFTVDVPANLFGICRGTGRDKAHPGFTDWLSDRIDHVAGLGAQSRPLRFGQLWSGTEDIPHRETGDRRIDLRMITTCLSQGRPYEMPWDARVFFYEPATWRTLFPEAVILALESAPPPAAPDPKDDAVWRWEERVAAAHEPSLRRLPDPNYLPVIVATRLSLSFPLLISAVPLWSIDRRDPESQKTTKLFKSVGAGSAEPTSGLRFTQLWFTDGGFCSNFPVHLFDAALASRPTFAINLGRFSANQAPSENETENVELAKNNYSLLPTVTEIKARGFASVAGFGSAALNTARNWQDGSHLNHPGFRDRIVRVLQTKSEGGMNLYMTRPTIERLAKRGQAAARVLIDQFTKPHYREDTLGATGWDNHRWVRYRALMTALPDWLASYAEGRKVLDIDPARPPSYDLSAAAQSLAESIAEALDRVAQVAGTADPEALSDLMEAPRPRGAIRRIPQI